MGTNGERVIREGPEAEHIRATERERLRALVAADLGAADLLHADDFQLINPRGDVLSKGEYLGGIASGYLDYRVWEVDSAIDVRLYDRVALIRYRSRLHMSLNGDEGAGAPRHYWHTDTYEERDGRWQIVRSQATAIQ